MPIKHTIDKMKDIAMKRGGECISSDYVNCKTKLEWKCSQGHSWKTTPSVIIKGHWCPICASKTRVNGQRLSIETMKLIALERGGKCLSNEYVNNRTKLLWECKFGHKWYARSNHIKKGQWCPYCIGRYPIIDDIKEFAIKSGGNCLSKKYINYKTKMIWECEKGHRWEATWIHVKYGTWCPKCRLSVGEVICKGYFERIFGKYFCKTRPEWLINDDDGNRMELDGYNEELGLAFEYQGK